MKLEIEKTTKTEGWSNKDFMPKFLELTLKNDAERPEELKIYFADKELIFEKKLFEGLPYLIFKQDPKRESGIFKLMPSLGLERRYSLYYLKCDKPDSIASVNLVHM